MIEKLPSLTTRRLLIAAGVFLIGAVVFGVLHNVFYALAAATGTGLLSDAFVFLSTASFLIALIVCPAGTVLCLVATALVPVTRHWPPALRGLTMLLVPVLLAVAGVFLLSRALGMSTIVRDDAAGFNGSFEVVADGLPANWHVYDRALARGDAQLAYDVSDPADGTQSLEMVVRRAEGRGGWRDAGLFHSMDAVAGQSYRVSFALRNRDARVRVRIASEKGDFRLPHDSIVETFDPQPAGDDAWQRFEFTYVVPQGYADIRFELNVLTPGTVWVDDVRIEPVP